MSMTYQLQRSIRKTMLARGKKPITFNKFSRNSTGKFGLVLASIYMVHLWQAQAVSTAANATWQCGECVADHKILLPFTSQVIDERYISVDKKSLRGCHSCGDPFAFENDMSAALSVLPAT